MRLSFRGSQETVTVSIEERVVVVHQDIVENRGTLTDKRAIRTL